MSQYSPQSVEEQIRLYWDHESIKSKVQEKSKSSANKFFFMDGPPYASGAIHMGTAWNKILKDAYIRFFRMKGFDVWDQPGYDTHGTPIEVKVEKELGFNSKKDIETFGVGKFIDKCKEFATKHISVMNSQFDGLGVWMDWSNPYLTLNNLYIEGAWYTFKKAFDKGLLYKDKYPVHVCSRCETVVAYNEIEHKKLQDESVFVKFQLKNEKGKFLVIWTTTPWTLPANTGVMVHPSFEYSFVKVGEEEFVLAKELVKPLMEKFKIEKYKISKTVKGEDLKGLEYTHPLKDFVDQLNDLKNGHKVLTSPRYVNLEDGTGLVHCAPGHGKEDYLVGKEFNSPILSFVNMDGRYSAAAGKWLAGKKARDANQEIVKKLEELGSLIKKEKIEHDYPTCWRCETPLLQMAVPQWFFKVTDIRQKLLDENKKVNWYPTWARDRFDNWLENLGDWPVSRQRYWGIPLPIWECVCGNIDVIGSYKELSEKAGLKSEIDFHRPQIDDAKIDCKKCKNKMSRIPDVLDVWFDSGVGTWASLNYPRFENPFKKFWPSELQIEGSDQFRGWWNSQIITSVITFDKVPFKNVITHGMVLDAKGIKMSKSKGNVVPPEEIIQKHGRDVMRFYLLSSEPWNDFYWNWEELKEYGRVLNVFWNVYEFVKMYGPQKSDRVFELQGLFDKKIKLKKEDEWILSKLFSLVKKQKSVEAYNLHEYVLSLKDFILNDFSRSYIKIIRDRISHFYEGEDKEAAQLTVSFVLENTLKLLAPICPHITDLIYTDLYMKTESVHLENLPTENGKMVRPILEEGMKYTDAIIETIHSLRSDKKIKLRWPVSYVVLDVADEVKGKIKDVEDVIKVMGNVKEVRFGKAKEKEFDLGKIDLGEPLEDEAFIRELIRKVQILRKEEKLNVSDKIALYLEPSKADDLIIKKYEKDLLEGVGAVSVEIGLLKKEKGELDLDGRKVKINFEGA